VRQPTYFLCKLPLIIYIVIAVVIHIHVVIDIYWKTRLTPEQMPLRQRFLFACHSRSFLSFPALSFPKRFRLDAC
jgi:hypothetical protein